jgi:hypothetical protein
MQNRATFAAMQHRAAFPAHEQWTSRDEVIGRQSPAHAALDELIARSSQTMQQWTRLSVVACAQ